MKIDFKAKKGFICDMDGVLYHGNRILPGAAEFVQWLQRENKEYLFLTNNSGMTPKELQQKLARMGLETAAGVHMVLGAFNLLPIRPLDGGRALYLGASWLLGPAAGEAAARWTGTAAALALVAGLSWLMVQSGGSLWLLPAAVGALTAAGRECFGK